MHYHGDLSLAVNQLGELARAHLAGLVIIGCNKGQDFIGIDAGIEHRDENAGPGGALDGSRDRCLIRGGDGESVDVARDHRVDDLNLAAILGLDGRAVPDDLDAELAPSRDRARLHGLPEELRSAFGNDGDDLLFRLLAPGEQETGDEGGGDVVAHRH